MLVCFRLSQPPCSYHFRLKQQGITGGVPVLLSTEKPRCKLVSPVDMEANNPLDYQVREAGCSISCEIPCVAVAFMTT